MEQNRARRGSAGWRGDIIAEPYDSCDVQLTAAWNSAHFLIQHDVPSDAEAALGVLRGAFQSAGFEDSAE